MTHIIKQKKRAIIRPEKLHGTFSKGHRTTGQQGNVTPRILLLDISTATKGGGKVRKRREESSTATHDRIGPERHIYLLG